MVLGHFVMIFKNKGSPNDCSKYRMICLLPTAYKMLSTLILQLLRTECEGFMNDDQCGFRNYRITRDQIITLTEVLNQVKEHNQWKDRPDNCIIASAAFLDYIAAFDSIDHCFLDEALALETR